MSYACNEQQIPWIIPLITSIGIFIFFSQSISLIRWISNTFFRTPKQLRKHYGSWVIVTGCTDGIGLAFACNLAQKGLNLILVSRSQEKLDRLASELRETTKDRILVRLLALDFSDNDISNGIGKIKEMASSLDVGILINNVGITYPNARFFHEVDEEVWRKIVRVNVEGTAEVTRAVLPGMVRRGRGAVVNISSGAGIVVPSHPLFTIYAATKAFVDQLSRSLHVEYKHHGIDVQCQVPLYIATKMASRVASIETTSIFVPSPEHYAEAAIRHIGYEARCTPYWSHSVQWFFACLIPDSLLDLWRFSLGLKRRAKTPPL